MTWTVILRHNSSLSSRVFIGPHDSNMARKHIMDIAGKSDNSEFVALIRGDHKPIFKTEAVRK